MERGLTSRVCEHDTLMLLTGPHEGTATRKATEFNIFEFASLACLKRVRDPVNLVSLAAALKRYAKVLVNRKVL